MIISLDFLDFIVMLKLMGLVETKNIFDAEPPEEKAKAAIVNVIDGRISILNLIRSELEDTRVGEGDWAGGSLEPGEMPIDGLLRDAGDELPGTILQNITELPIHNKTRLGQQVVSHLFVASAIFPETGIQLSEEHSDYGWIPLEEYSGVDIPDKYKDALQSRDGLYEVHSLAFIIMHSSVLSVESISAQKYQVPQLLAA